MKNLQQNILKSNHSTLGAINIPNYVSVYLLPQTFFLPQSKSLYFTLKVLNQEMIPQEGGRACFLEIAKPILPYQETPWVQGVGVQSSKKRPYSVPWQSVLFRQ